jgi:hypothetical protein
VQWLAGNARSSGDGCRAASRSRTSRLCAGGNRVVPRPHRLPPARRALRAADNRRSDARRRHLPCPIRPSIQPATRGTCRQRGTSRASASRCYRSGRSRPPRGTESSPQGELALTPRLLKAHRPARRPGVGSHTLSRVDRRRCATSNRRERAPRLHEKRPAGTEEAGRCGFDCRIDVGCSNSFSFSPSIRMRS